MIRYYTVTESSEMIGSSLRNLKLLLKALGYNRRKIDVKDFDFIKSVHNLRKESGIKPEFISKIRRSTLNQLLELCENQK